MNKISIFAGLVLLVLVTSCGQPAASDKNKTIFAIQKTDAEWKEILSPLAYQVMVKKGTEPPFNNPYDRNYQSGIYVSAATGEPLFSSEDKFDSGTGWPSFTKPISPAAIKVIKETYFGVTGEEVLEAKTGLHLGHVFNDGPKDKGGKRYCMNSAALKFIKK
ncbi:MAG TPA: peptide-methionine (R)-S-oxide reductase MsrB [Daejeonella sp.]|nr:peptide-methionine (R)-S-oxide reductase MsrB [Daejeonella sp.]